MPVRPARADPPTTRQSGLPGYQILAVDAETGAAGIIYSTRAADPCGLGVQRPASVAPAAEFVSVPWMLVARGPGAQSATITYRPRPCDQPTLGMFLDTGKPVVLADGTHPGLVRVELTRVLTTCGAAVPTYILLRGATVTTQLPQQLVHAPVGAEDGPDGG